jgi:hypothetical protein
MRRSRYQSPEGFQPDFDQLPFDTICTVLVRQSSVKQTVQNTFSAEANPKDLIREAQRQGFAPERIKVLDWDMGIGAYNTIIEDRPALHHWLTKLLPGKESRVVLVSQEDRLFRDRTEIQVNRFIELVGRQGGWVICGIGNARIYNFRREMDRELFRMACKYGRQYIEYHIKGRLHPAIQRTAMAGRYSGGPVPWGYVVNYDSQSPLYKHFAPYDPHAKLVTNHVFQIFAAMPFPSVVEVARHWGSLGLVWPFFGPEVDPRRVRLLEGHCTRNEARGGYEFHFQQAHHILTDVAYLGWRTRSGQVAWDDEREEPRICHAPLVEEELFWWCYDQLLAERPTWAPPQRTQVVQAFRPRPARRRDPDRVSFLVPGRVRCAQHGNVMGVMLYPDDRPYLRCHGNDRLRLKEGTCSAMLATSVEQMISETFLAQLALDEEDVRNLAHLAARRTSVHVDERDTLQRELAKQQQRYTRAKRLALDAGDEALANDFFAEACQARLTIAELEQQLASQTKQMDVPTSAWAKAEWMANIAERIRSTFLEWPRLAQERVLMLALHEGFLGRIDRRRMGLLLRWQGGAESRRELVSRVGLLTAWSEEEEEALRTYFHQLTWEALLRMLPNRTKDAIKREASRLELKRPRHELSDCEPYTLAQPEPVNVMKPYGFPLGARIQVAAGGVVTAKLSVAAPRHSMRSCSSDW